MNTLPELLSEHACFGGVQRFYQHGSRAIGLPMKFSVFLPPQAMIEEAGGKVPALIYLAGLTCNEETFMTKAGAQRLAATLGLALIAPDTSPRGANLPGDTESWDFGVGASFYLDASMSLSTMFASGLALAQPQLKVWAFMGDGAFCMNPGMLMVERQM